MVFDLDLNAYKIVDLSLQVTPNWKVEGRPFDVKLGRLGDGTRKFDIVNTHTHVGTHVESPWHYYEEGNTCADYPLDHYMGKATLLKGALESGKQTISLEQVKAVLEPRRGAFDILVVRNDTAERPLRFDMACVEYMAGFNLKLFVFEANIEFGQGLQDGKTFHEQFLGRDTLLVEFPANLDALTHDHFFVVAMPLNISQLDSSGCRLFAIVEK